MNDALMQYKVNLLNAMTTVTSCLCAFGPIVNGPRHAQIVAITISIVSMDQCYGQRGIVGPTLWSTRYRWTNFMVNEVLRDYVDEIWIIHDLSAKVIVSRETCNKNRYILMGLGKCI